VLRLTRLRLTRFRNHHALDMRFQARAVVLTGPNGAGKTNVLEAISLLAPGRGLRGARVSELADGGSGPGAVSGSFEDSLGRFEVGPPPYRFRIDRQLWFPYGADAEPRLVRLKTKASRARVPVSRETIKVIAQHLNTYGTGRVVDGRTLLWSTTGKHNCLGVFLLHRHVSNAAVKGVGRHLHPHDLRHLYASTAIASGAGAHEVQKLLRHSDVGTTLSIYAHAFEAATLTAAAAVERALAQAQADFDAAAAAAPLQLRRVQGSDQDE
jgi:energy-coupling factor transporter ATP-binding protein EcfA2